MNYKAMIQMEIPRFLQDTNYTFSEILSSIITVADTGARIENKTALMQVTDEQWFHIIERAFSDAKRTDKKLTDEEFANWVEKNTWKKK